MHPLISRSMPILLSIALASCSMPGISAPEIDTPSEPAMETRAVSGTGYQATGASSGCEFVYKQGVYADAELAKKKTDKIMKFDGKIRKFSMRLPGNCADRRTSEDRVSFFFIQGFFFLPSGP
ncbi:MAG TPA: hypothetical protein PK765_07875, partial [bacterium]|nr:hypothetical protein [bacterium]